LVYICVCAVLCLGWGLATSWSLVQEVLPSVSRSGNWKAVRAHKRCRAIKKGNRLDDVRGVHDHYRQIQRLWSYVLICTSWTELQNCVSDQKICARHTDW
jgi:hypothetical protein